MMMVHSVQGALHQKGLPQIRWDGLTDIVNRKLTRSGNVDKEGQGDYVHFL